MQDTTIDSKLQAYDGKLHSIYATEEKASIFGNYQSLDMAKLGEAASEVQETIAFIQGAAKKEALKTVVIFPIFMVFAYILLMIYFKYKGGYKPVVLPEKEKVPLK